MQPANPTDVHAGYFQLADELALDYQLIEPPGDDQLHTDDSSPLFGLLGELQLLDHESQHLLRQIGERDREFYWHDRRIEDADKIWEQETEE